MSYFKNMKGKNSQTCSTTMEVVEFVSSLIPNVLQDANGNPHIGKVLFMLGFQVSPTDMCYVTKNALVRNSDRPYMVYETTVFTGNVRNEVSHVDVNGDIVFNPKQRHFMERVYVENEILTLSGLDTSVMKNINDVGIKEFYEKGMAALDRRVDAEKPDRNIVDSMADSDTYFMMFDGK